MKPAIARDLDALLTKKPMARAERVTLFEREVRERLSVAAIDLVLDRARILSEGKRAASLTARQRYFGSTMITIDVAELAQLVRDPCDVRSATRIAELIGDDARVLRRVQKLAEKEAQRLCGGPVPVKVRAGEVRVRAQGTLIYLDIDVDE